MSSKIPRPLKPFNKKQAKIGMDIEKEHQDVTHGDPTLTAKIAAAHLEEDPAYYTKLKNMEKGFPKFESVIRDILSEISCWSGYKKRGTKKKGGKTVNNCVKESVTSMPEVLGYNIPKNKDRRVADVDWDEPDVQIGTAWDEYEIKKFLHAPDDSIIYKTLLDLGDVGEKLAGGADNYDWSELERNRSAPPPPVIIRKKNGSIKIADGNHRIYFWKNRGKEYAPVWVYDEPMTIYRRKVGLSPKDFNIIPEAIQFFDPNIYHQFFIELAAYQSNHYGSYHSSQLLEEYIKLPESFRNFMSLPKSQYKNCFRGDDGKNEKPVTSFVYNKDPEIAKRNAAVYGHYIFSLIRDGKSLISTMTTDFRKFEKFFGKKQWHKIVDDYGIGDDENEVLVFGLKYK